MRIASFSEFINESISIEDDKQFELDRERILKIAKDCKSRSDFKKKHRHEYDESLQNGVIDEIDWFIFNDGRDRCVYIYKDDENKVAYAGLTVDINERDKTHRTGYYHGIKKFSAVYEYFKSINKEVPKPIIIKDNLSIKESQKLEDDTKQKLIEKGYIVLNTGATGEGVGSIGAIPKWTKEKVFAASLECSGRREFEDKYGRAYKLSIENHWIDEMTWLKPKRRSWNNYLDVYEEAKKYTSREDFYLYSGGAAQRAKKEGWIDSFDWMPKQTYQWEDYDKVYNEAKKYKTPREFIVGCGAAYQSAKRHDWMKDFDWIVPERKHCKTEEEALETAKKCQTRDELRHVWRGAYSFMNGKGHNKTGEKLWYKIPHLSKDGRHKKTNNIQSREEFVNN